MREMNRERKVVREKHSCDIYMQFIKAIYSTIHCTSLDKEEMKKNTREIWHVADVYM